MPDFYLMGGPNGAGKTTIALRLLPACGCPEFVNADAIAGALSPFAPENVALQAGVLMLRRLRELTAKEVSFGTESTLAARAFVPFIQECRARSYGFKLCYIWLPSAEAAIARGSAGARWRPRDTGSDHSAALRSRTAQLLAALRAISGRLDCMG